MIHLKQSPRGIDASIQRLQEHLYGKLTQAWPSVRHKSFGRCYRNRGEQGYVAEVYVGGQDRDYEDVMWDDNYDVVSFFGVSETARDLTRMATMVHLVYFVNLDKVRPGNGQERPDEEVKIDVLRLIGKVLYGFHLETVEVGLDLVLREYKGSAVSESLSRIDMHPLHAFRLNFSLHYNPFQTL